MWVLILTIIVGNHAEIRTIEGFAAEEVCQDAGEKWLEKVKVGKESNHTASILCVSKQREIDVTRSF